MDDSSQPLSEQAYAFRHHRYRSESDSRSFYLSVYFYTEKKSIRHLGLNFEQTPSQI